MKKWLIGVMTVLMAVSLAACTPTTEKQKKETTAATAAKSQEDMVPPSTGGASDKVPDPNVMPVAVISVYHGGEGSLVQDMDSLDTEGLDAQLLVDKLIEYGVLEDGTKVLKFDTADGTGTLDLSQVPAGGEGEELLMLTAIGNTFTENFELDKIKLLVNGKNYSGTKVKQGDGDYLEYVKNYKEVK